MADAAQPSVDDAIGALSDQALVCRDMGHSWQHFRATIEMTKRKRITGYTRILRCRVCTTERHTELDAYGSIIKSHYVYPDNYLVPGVGRFSGEYRDAARLVNVIKSAKEEHLL